MNVIFQTGDIITISEPASQAGIAIITNQKMADDCNSGVIKATRNSRNPLKCIAWLRILDDDEVLKPLRSKNFRDALLPAYGSALYSPPEYAPLIWEKISEALSSFKTTGILTDIVSQVVTDKCIIPTTDEFTGYLRQFEERK